MAVGVAVGVCVGVGVAAPAVHVGVGVNVAVGAPAGVWVAVGSSALAYWLACASVSASVRNSRAQGTVASSGRYTLTNRTVNR